MQKSLRPDLSLKDDVGWSRVLCVSLAVLSASIGVTVAIGSGVLQSFFFDGDLGIPDTLPFIVSCFAFSLCFFTFSNLFATREYYQQQEIGMQRLKKKMQEQEAPEGNTRTPLKPINQEVDKSVFKPNNAEVDKRVVLCASVSLLCSAVIMGVSLYVMALLIAPKLGMGGVQHNDNIVDHTFEDSWLAHHLMVAIPAYFPKVPNWDFEEDDGPWLPGYTFRETMRSHPVLEFYSAKTQHDGRLIFAESSSQVNWKAFNGTTQMVNRIHGERSLTTKDCFPKTMQYRDPEIDPEFHVMPTWFVTEEKKECLEFKDELQDQLGLERKVGKSARKFWIWKLSKGSMGDGTQVFTTENMLNKLGDCEFPSSVEAIVQEYFQHPLLLDGYKSEVRFFWVLMPDWPFPDEDRTMPRRGWRVLLWPRPFVRRTSSKFDLNNVEDIAAHVTNLDVQKKNSVNDLDESELRWTIERLEEYLKEQKVIDRNDYPNQYDWLNRYLVPRVVETLQSISNATFRRFTTEGVMINPKDTYYLKTDSAEQGNHGRYVLLGLDLMLDETATKPYVLEVQTGPALAMDHEAKRGVIEPMLQNLTHYISSLLYTNLDFFDHEIGDYNSPDLDYEGEKGSFIEVSHVPFWYDGWEKDYVLHKHHEHFDHEANHEEKPVE